MLRPTRPTPPTPSPLPSVTSTRLPPLGGSKRSRRADGSNRSYVVIASGCCRIRCNFARADGRSFLETLRPEYPRRFVHPRLSRIHSIALFSTCRQEWHSPLRISRQAHAGSRRRPVLVQLHHVRGERGADIRTGS